MDTTLLLPPPQKKLLFHFKNCNNDGSAEQTNGKAITLKLNCDNGEQVSHSVRWPEYKADNSLPPRAEVKKGWNYIFTTAYSFMVCKETLLLLHYIHNRPHSK